MTAPISPLPASLLRAERRHHDLDARIEEAELRLISREENLRRRVSELGHRVRAGWQPRKLVLPLAAGAGLATLGWLVYRRAVPPGATTQASPVRGAGGDGAGLARWLHLLPLLWPLLPEAWQSRVPPPVRNLVLAAVIPLMELLRRRRPAKAASAASDSGSSADTS